MLELFCLGKTPLFGDTILIHFKSKNIRQASASNCSIKKKSHIFQRSTNYVLIIEILDIDFNSGVCCIINCAFLEFLKRADCFQTVPMNFIL